MKGEKMTIEENLKKAINLLRQIEAPSLKARLLLCHVLQVSKEYLVIHSKEELTNEQEKIYDEKIVFLQNHVPIEYITNQKEFMKLNFYVDENVLIPRPDTEVTVEEVILYCKKEKQGKAKILDLCTGSGAIAISLAKYLPNCEIVGVDISEKALKIAKKNQVNNFVENVDWICSNLFEEIKDCFDVIVSNPPYIKRNVIPHLQEEVKKEPILALDGGEDGLVFYKAILKQAKEYLNPKGAIFLEIGYDQKKEIIEIAKQCYADATICCKQDIGARDRMIEIKI